MTKVLYMITLDCSAARIARSYLCCYPGIILYPRRHVKGVARLSSHRDTQFGRWT